MIDVETPIFLIDNGAGVWVSFACFPVTHSLKTLLVFPHPQDLSLDQVTEEDCQVAANEIQREYEAHG